MSNNTTNTTTSYVLAVVTGASGFVGSAVALRFLDLGHSVRLPLRSPQQGEAWIKQYGDKYPGKIETVVLEGSITEKGVFDKILEGCDVVVHAASPATFTVVSTASFSLPLIVLTTLPQNDPETDILKPALAGTLSLLESAKKTASVKSVVLTSSCVSLRPPSRCSSC
jgi:nucleoside-diphosphate-sugar epimerase